MELTKIMLKTGKEKSILNRHPWIFSGAIDKIEGNPVEGDIVKVYSANRIFLAIGHYHEGSIKVRIISFDDTEINSDFWFVKLKHAYQLRKSLSIEDNQMTNGYRLIHAEGDCAPGLIVDIYNNSAVIQTHTAGMYLAIEHIKSAIESIYGNKIRTILAKSKYSPAEKNLDEAGNEFLLGCDPDTIIAENGYSFYVNIRDGQKTGFFLDQRENRLLLQRYTAGKRVLNTFSYSGAFSIYALKGGASNVISVDSSSKAEEWTARNLEMNSCSENHSFINRDVFDYFNGSESVFNLVVLDPPAFAKHINSKNQAAAAYQKLNYEAIRKLEPGGTLFTFSCSQIIDRKLFRQIVFASCAKAGRNVRILHQMTQPPDHPVSIYHPEGEYLKGLVLYME